MPRALVRNINANETSTLKLTERMGGLGKGAVDRDKSIVKGLRVANDLSVNGRSYREALEAAAGLYEGANVSFDHPEGMDVPPVSSRFGQLVGARYSKDAGQGAITADLHYNPKHPLAEQFLWFAENQPGAVALSHRVTAKAKKDPRTGLLEVKSIEKVLGVEIVTEGGTTTSLFEAADQGAAGDAAASEEQTVQEPAELEACVAEVLKKGFDKDRAYAICNAKASEDAAPAEVTEAEVGDRVLCRGYGDAQLIGEVVKKAPALLVRVGDQLKTVFEDEAEIVTTEPAAAEGAAAPTTEGADPMNPPKTLATLTLEEIKAARPDVVKAIADETRAGDNSAGELKRLREDNARLVKEADERTAKDALATRKASRAKLIADAKLPPELVTDVFREQVEAAASDELAKKLVEDRAGLAKAGPTSKARTLQAQSGGDGTEKLTEAKFTEAVVG